MSIWNPLASAAAFAAFIKHLAKRKSKESITSHAWKHSRYRKVKGPRSLRRSMFKHELALLKG